MNRAIVRVALTLLGALAISACTQNTVGHSLSSSGKIAVISFLGHQFNALENVRPKIDLVEENYNTSKNVRPILFDEKKLASILNASPMNRWSHEIDDWGIDKEVISAASALLAPQHPTISFAYDPAAFKDKGIVHFLDEDETAAHVAEIIRAQPGFSSAKDVEAYIVIVPGGRELTAGFPRPSYGVGIAKDFQAYHRLSATFEDVYMLHAFFYVMVLDGGTLEKLAGAAGRHKTRFQKRFKGYPGLFVDASYWAPDFDALAQPQRETISKQIQEMLVETLPDTFGDLGLIP